MKKEKKQQDIYLSFFKMSYQICALEELHSSEKIVYSILASLSNNRGYAYAKNEYIAKKTGLKSGSVSKIIRNLTSKGFLKCEDNANHLRKIYVLIPEYLVQPNTTVTGKSSPPNTTVTGQPNTTVTGKSSPPNTTVTGQPNTTVTGHILDNRLDKIKDNNKSELLVDAVSPEESNKEEAKAQEPCIQKKSKEPKSKEKAKPKRQESKVSDIFETTGISEILDEIDKLEKNKPEESIESDMFYGILQQLKIKWPRTLSNKDIDKLKKLDIEKQKLLLKNADRYIALHKGWKFHPGLSKCIDDLGYTEEYLKSKEIKPVDTQYRNNGNKPVHRFSIDDY